MINIDDEDGELTLDDLLAEAAEADAEESNDEAPATTEGETADEATA